MIAGRFRVEAVIGSGGFGVVLRARREPMGQEVALKVLRPGLLESPESIKRFEREAALAQRLEHPNTVRVLDFGRAVEDGVCFIAFELLRGRPLDEVLRGTTGLPSARIAKITAQILKSLMEAHGHGIVHRDVKPSNIFLCEYAGEHDYVKLLDFGIAKSIEESAAETKLTQEGHVVGTPSYMAPEQITGKGVCAATDLYALGLVMAEMMTGETVYTGPSPVAVCAQHLSQDPAPLPRDVLQHDLGPVVLRATQKAISFRYTSAAEMLAHLDEVQSSSRTPMPVLPPTVDKFALAAPHPPPWPSPAGPLLVQLPARRAGKERSGSGAGPALVGIGILLLVLVGGGAALMFGSSPPGSSRPSPRPAAASAALGGPPAARGPTELTVEREMVTGKWPEGVVVAGDDAWVAESGDRQIARVDLAGGKVKKRIAVGRLPVQMAASPEGHVYALTHTDQSIWVIDPATDGARELARLPESPQDMAYADGALWVLLWSGGSSKDSSIARVDPANGTVTRSAPLGPDAWSIAVGSGRVWVAHGRGKVSLVDQQTLDLQPPLQGGTCTNPGCRGTRHIAAVAGAVFTDVATGVVRIDPSSGGVTHRRELPELVFALEQSTDEVIVVGQSGRVWLLAPADLAVRAELRAPPGMREPHAVARRGESLLITAAKADELQGKLWVVRPR